MKKLFLAMLCLAAGCEVLEEDLTNRTVEVLAPADKVAVAPGEVNFRWQALPGAAGYEFMLVAPRFAAAERIVADTIIRADSLSRHYGCRITLPEGEYEWSVVAFNGGYTGLAAIRSLTVRNQ